MSERPTGIVLAGGPGRRLGGPKAGVVLAGRPLVAIAVEALVPLSGEVIVVSREGVTLPRVAAARVVSDRPGPAGPLAAIATGLVAAGTDQCLVLACDLPLAGTLVARLLTAGAPDQAAVGVDGEGRAQPLCARYPRKATLAMCEALIGRGELRARMLLAALDVVEVPARGDELLNVNTPEDRDRAGARMVSGNFGAERARP